MANTKNPTPESFDPVTGAAAPSNFSVPPVTNKGSKGSKNEK